MAFTSQKPECASLRDKCHEHMLISRRLSKPTNALATAQQAKSSVATNGVTLCQVVGISLLL